MSRRLDISWGLNQEEQQVCQEPKTESWESNCDPKGRHTGLLWFPAEEPWLWSASRESPTALSEGACERISKVQEEEKAATFKRRPGCSIVDQCSKDEVWPREAVQHLFVEGLSRKLERVKVLVCSWKSKVPLPKRWSSHYSLAKVPILEENPGFK